MAVKLKQLAKESYFNKCHEESDGHESDQNSLKSRSLSKEEIQ